MSRQDPDDLHVCPNCGSGEVWRDSANVGVGIIYGPYGCAECGWSEDDTYDLSKEGRDALNEDGSVTDQFGTHYPAENSVALAYRLAAQQERNK